MADKIRGRVIGSLKPGTIEIHVAYGFGMNNGGGFERFDQREIPFNCRMPNTDVWIFREKGKYVKVEKMTSKE